MEEHYVSFEIAKMLKAKKFYLPCRHWFDANGTVSQKYLNPEFPINYDNVPYFVQPTCASVMYWLREKYKIIISPYYTSIGWYYEIYSMIDSDITGCKPLYRIGIPSPEQTGTYEEAVENAIKYTLEHFIN